MFVGISILKGFPLMSSLIMCVLTMIFVISVGVCVSAWAFTLMNVVCP